ncbi:hypothetical protein P6144_09760 [Sphingomonas sp. HITSZ_GF]|uniref:hypothetical protein n=1 Tax=Sphingomonas sp. HITSZ_GF TaxID=3037247 RepID=UPI00240E465C|nr:hypothetical protein [Sphingomonas sp. HITSZ_GF]MDG2533931.1 hypothetical protein [Sphingomonas sp. HITSZ_GF]
MGADQTSHLSSENLELLLDRERVDRAKWLDDLQIIRWRPCNVRVLVVADGLDFDPTNGFGLTTFVRALLDMPGSYVRFAITLAHLDDIEPDSVEMMPGETRIAARIPNFKFDVAAHFAPDRFDVIFLFGIDSFYSRGAGYPADSLSDAELQAIAEFQNGGGGLFATGDHGSLGKAMCHKVARARGMRLWDSTSAQNEDDQVSMDGPRRNDTNRRGDATSEFDDQSDDIPQTISPVFYSRRNGIFRYTFPHPLLCSPTGPIRVMPDHPHEGQCALPEDVEATIDYTASLGPEYPPASDGGARPLPEIISYNTVLPGTTSGGKDPTISQTFAGICAYDGHRAGVGRVVTDSTWHHFVNINLVGIPTKPVGDPKRLGFLASPTGQAHFEAIKTYYRNLAVWLSPPERIQCMNSHFLWWIVQRERVLEAVLTARAIGLEKVDTRTLSLIGRHARDVLGRYAGPCQSMRVIIDLLQARPELVKEIDPWIPRDAKLRDLERVEDGEELPLVDLQPMLEAVLGGALVAIGEAFPKPVRKEAESFRGDEVLSIATRGAEVAIARAERSLEVTLGKAGRALLRGGGAEAM